MTTATDPALLKLEWKSSDMLAYGVALVRAGYDLLRNAQVYFNNDDVPEADQPRDRTTVGATFMALSAAGVICPWRGNDPAAEIYGGIRRSTRPECHSHRNQLWTLTSVAIAEEWLRRHGYAFRPVQGDLFDRAGEGRRAEPSAHPQGVEDADRKGASNADDTELSRGCGATEGAGADPARPIGNGSPEDRTERDPKGAALATV